MKSYILLQDRFEHKAGTKVYDCHGYDYGCARDDTEFTGLQHQSVTLKEDGDYPFFSVPTAHLKPLD